MLSIDLLMTNFKPSPPINDFLIRFLRETIRRNEKAFSKRSISLYKNTSQQHHTTPPEISLFTSDSQRWIRKLTKSTIEDLEDAEEYGVTILPVDPRACDLTPPRSALDTIRQHSPLTFHLINTMVREIVLVGGCGLRGASSKKHLGTILVGIRENSSTADCMEAFTHEASHIDLYIRGFATDFIKCPNHSLSSPIRSKSRPADAVLHATFVTARVALALSEVARHTPDIEMRNRCAIIATRNLMQSIQGVETLQAADILTCTGKKLISNIKSWLDTSISPHT